MAEAEAVVSVTLVGEGRQPETRSMTADLARLLVLARRANSHASRPDSLELTFSSLLYGLMAAHDPCARFFQSEARSVLKLEALWARKGVDPQTIEGIQASRVDPTEWESRFSASVSALALLQNAEQIRQRTRSGKAIDTLHLLAAFIYEPAGHDRDLISLGFERPEWSARLRDWLRGTRGPVNSVPWDLQHAATFADASSRMEASSEGSTFASSAAAGEGLAFASSAAAGAPETGSKAPARKRPQSQPPPKPAPRASSRWDRAPFDNDAVEEHIPLDQDQLGMRDEVERFARLLAAADVKPPIAIGLFGRWGSGKSFFMGMLRHRIRSLRDADAQVAAHRVARVAQITFNAWHYHDTDIWAGLALRIYERLAVELGGAQATDVAKKRAELRERLASNRAQVDEAMRRRAEAERVRVEVTKRLEKHRRGRQQASNALSLERLQRVGVDDRFKAAQAKLKAEVARILGKPLDAKHAADIEAIGKVARELQAAGSGVHAAVTVLLSAFRSAGSTFVTCLVLAAAVAVVLGLHELATTQGWSSAVENILQFGTVAGSGLAWIGARLRALHGAVQAAETMREVLAAPANARPSERERQLAARLEKIEAAIRLDDEKVATAEQRAKEAEAEIQRINAGGLVYDFLQQRGQAEPYVTQLGLVSTIRRDFEKLRELLQDLREHSEDPIDRIVLYIDDLDRCHPDKVVQVLQAVHLLLAFDLFHVVVGVDARWLENSLERVYVGAGGARADSSPFSPQNYLEKIFQIPYSLAPMEPKGFAKLIDRLIVTRTERDGKVSAKAESRLGDDSRRRAGDGNRVANDTNIASPPPKDPPPRVVDVREELESLFLEDFEEAFLQKLHAFVPTPRLAKRLVNLYRLLRARASQEDFESFAPGPQSGSYRQAAILLAMHIGHPRVGGRILHLLSAASDEPFETFLKGLAATKRFAWTDAERGELESIGAKVKALAAADRPAPLEHYRHWAERIGCYAFDWHLVRELQPPSRSPN